ncbi:MAG: hypothetical protein JWM95_4878 [Gemmatimonadetes bacterium]|nr:hypothetical protein [Gemmatimonadota bacterium]
MTVRRGSVLLILAALACVPLVKTRDRKFADDFSLYADRMQFGEGAHFGAWTVEFGGYGAVRVSDGSLELIPAQTAQSTVTHSVLVTGPAFTQPMDLEVRLFTGAQLRIGDMPNPWEAAWIMWAYTDAAHAYYFLPKPNGWELAKRDPAYKGGQRIMATGDTPVFLVNHWYDVRITQRGGELTVFVDGARVASFNDTERPYTSGKIALYTEDAAVRFDDVQVY